MSCQIDLYLSMPLQGSTPSYKTAVFEEHRRSIGIKRLSVMSRSVCKAKLSVIKIN